MKLNRKRLLLGLALMLLLSALYLMALAPAPAVVESARTESNDLPFAERGPHGVGTRTLTMGADGSEELTMWYPGQTPSEGAKSMTYRYEIKVVPSLGANSIATYKGLAISDAREDLSAGPYPLVILSPGYAIGSTTYGWLAEHLASHGLVVLSPEHDEYLFTAVSELWQSAITRPQVIPAVLDYVSREIVAGGGFEGLIDGERIAVIGHSYGGYTALAAGGARLHTAGFEARCQVTYERQDPGAWLCDALLPHIADMAQLAGLEAIPDGLWPTRADQRVDAVVTMAGDAYLFDQAGLAQLAIPVMAIGGTLDKDTPYMWGTHPTYEYASSPAKVRVTLNDAEHMVFAGPCEAIRRFIAFAPNAFCADTHWNRNAAHDVVAHFTTAFLLAELVHDAEASTALEPAGYSLPDVTYEAEGY